MTLLEQRGVHTLRAHRAAVPQRGSRHWVGTSHGLHPEDTPILTDERRHPARLSGYEDDDDDALYATRPPSSARRYVSAPPTTPAPRTRMQVTHHQGPPPTPRASRTQAPPVSQHPAPAPRAPRRVHVLVYVGSGMVAMVLGWMLLSSLAQWWQGQQETWQYGYPRTFQMDADVRHGGISHFTVENLDGHILIIEVQVASLTKSRIYAGPVFSGPGADTQPATVSFQDVNGDGYPDMLIAVGTGRSLYINDHTGFRPATASDLITVKGV